MLQLTEVNKNSTARRA